MHMNRRRLLATGGAVATAVAAKAQTTTATPPVSQPQSALLASVQQRLIDRARENIFAVNFDGHALSGPGWELLVREGRASEFVLFGEEHGTHEAPLLAKELFLALLPAGYDTLGVEISPPIAEDLDRAARGGIHGIAQFCTQYPPGPAFYFWESEAGLIAASRTAIPGHREMLWGIDYEVTGDRRLIARLAARAPNSARSALNALDQASQHAWAAWRTTHNPGALFTFSGDPALVRAVRDAWTHRDADIDNILTTLEKTLEINALFPARPWDSNERRALNMRANLVRHLNRAASENRRPKALFKMGENHLQRGVNWTGNFDTGSLLHEVAALRGGKAFSVLVGGGVGGRHGVLNPTEMTTAEAPVDMFEQLGLTFLTSLVTQPGPSLMDLRPLRSLVASSSHLRELNNPEAVRNIMGYDALVVWNGSTATQMLVRV